MAEKETHIVILEVPKGINRVKVVLRFPDAEDKETEKGSRAFLSSREWAHLRDEVQNLPDDALISGIFDLSQFDIFEKVCEPRQAVTNLKSALSSAIAHTNNGNLGQLRRLIAKKTKILNVDQAKRSVLKALISDD